MGSFLKSCVRAARIVYRCMQCGAKDVKLWRNYNTNIKQAELYCSKCACQHTGEPGAIRSDGTHDGPNGKPTNKIGELVPAIPTKESDAFWGLRAIPPRLYRWWESRPLKQDGPPGSAARKPGELLDLLVEYHKLGRDVKKAQDRQDEIKDQVDEGLQGLGLDQYSSGGYKAAWGDSSWTDNKGLLDELQVPAEKIEEYKRTTPTLRITGPRS